MYSCPMTYNTLKHGENTFRDVILVALGFHLCSHCLSMLAPFIQDDRTTNTLRANRLCLVELLSGEPTFGRNDLIRSQSLYVQTVFTFLNVTRVGSLRKWAQGKLLLYFKTTRLFISKLIYVNCDRVHSERVKPPLQRKYSLRMSARKGNVRKYLIYRECVATSENQCIKYTAPILTISAISQAVTST